MPSLRSMGVVQSTATARDLLFEDEAAEQKKLPCIKRRARLEDFKDDWVTLELDLGSVLGFTQHWQDSMAERIAAAIKEVNRICRNDWLWHISERNIYDQVMFSQLTSKTVAPETDKLVTAVTDQRKFIMFNFASRDDAMLVRMTIVDLRSVRHDDSGGLPSDS